MDKNTINQVFTVLIFLSGKIPLISHLVQYLPLFLHFLYTLSNFISTFASCKKIKVLQRQKKNYSKQPTRLSKVMA